MTIRDPARAPSTATRDHAATPTPGGVIAALLAVQLAFASGAIVGKVVLHRVPVLAFVGMRIGGAAAAFALLAARSGRSLWAPHGARLAVLRLVFLGLIINQTLFLDGLRRTTAINAAVLSAVIPLATVVYAIATGREAARRNVWIGTALAMSGAVVIVRPEQVSFSDAHWVGNVMLIVNSVSYAAYLVHARELIERHGAIRVLTWIFTMGAIVIAPLAVPSLAANASRWDTRTWAAVAYFVAVPTAFAYGANAWALQRAPSSLVAVFIYLQPLLAAVMAMAIGNPLASLLRVPAPNEVLDARTALGGLAILAGVGIASRRRNR